MRPGQRLGQYELICQTAQGGMASIWLARSTGSRGFTKVVAIKTMLPAVVEQPDAERMFLAEAAVASRIEHPNVVQTLDLCEDGGALYLVMEWVRGEALGTVYSAAAARGGMPLGTAVRIVSQIAAGLHAAHELVDASGKCLGLVHRDVSPQNVLVGFNGVVKLVDFGIAKLTTESDEPEGSELRGKVAYMAPEQIRLEAVDRRTDIFAAGILLYLLTTSQHPFKRGDLHETALAVLSDEPVTAPSRIRDGYPARLERVVLRALAKNPADRYASAREFGEDLTRALPPSHHGAGHEELRTYMKELLPAHFAKHQQLVRLARDVHEATLVSAPVTIGNVFKQSGRSSSTLRAVAVPAAPEAAQTSSAPPPRDTGADLPAHAREHKKTLLVFLGGVLFAALGLTALVRSPANSNGAEAQSATPVDVRSAGAIEPVPASAEPEQRPSVPPPAPAATSTETGPDERAVPPVGATSRENSSQRVSPKASRVQPRLRPPGQATNTRKNGPDLKDPY